MKYLFSLVERNYLILFMLLLLGYILFQSLQVIFPALLGSVVIYTLFQGWNLYFIKKGWKRWLSATTIILISFFIIVLPVFLLIFMVVDKAGDFMGDPAALKALYANLDQYTTKLFNRPDFIKTIISRVQSEIFQLFRGVIGRAFDIFLQITVMYFIIFFMFVNYEKFEKAVLKYTPFKPSANKLFADELRHITFSNVVGQGIIAAVQGLLLGIGFLIFGIPGAFFWGVVTMFLSFIPIIGSPLVFVPAAVYTISTGNTGSGVGLLIYGLVLLINIDNILRLMIAKRVGNIHPLITVVGVVIGLPLFGMLGLIYGPLLLSFFILLVKVYEQNQKEIVKSE